LYAEQTVNPAHEFWDFPLNGLRFLLLIASSKAVMGFDLSEFLKKNRSSVRREWAKRLNAEVGERYSKRPIRELFETVLEAYDANYHVLIHDDFSPINKFIEKITRMRLEAGFKLSDVQKAFELYRSIIIRILAQKMEIGEFSNIIASIDTLLAYTIHRFSDHFQAMHEKQILDYALRLEEDVRKRTRELKVSQLKYKTLVEEINDGYFVVQDGVIVFANKAFCRMHGYQLKEVLGKEFQVFIDPRSLGIVLQIYDKSLKKSPAPHVFEYIRLTKDGGSFPTEITAKITNYENRPSNIGICRDITGRVKMEQRMREAERMAYIGQIATSLSHEIRNPLSAVKMNLQILKKNTDLKVNDQRRIDISVKEVIRLEQILSELLDFAKPLQLERAFTNINDILASCSELLEMRLNEENIKISTEFDSNIPKLWADAQRLEQAFINLLLNAIEASEEKGKIVIKTLYIPDGGSPGTEILIEDEGHGVPEELLDEIFKPFFTTKSKGTGLGLSNVKRIVDVHGGTLEVVNLKPKGTSLRVLLPVGKNNV